MAIKIITFHRALNYGAVLQAAALQRFLSANGYEAALLDYRSPYIESFYHPFHNVGNPREFIRSLLFAPFVLYKRFRFVNFLKKYSKISPPTAPRDLPPLGNGDDWFVAGSDQIWNNHWSGFDKAYFLDFVSDPEKKCSYAASFGFDAIPQPLVSEYTSLLSGFSHISVREKSAQQIVKDLLGWVPERMIDPACLLTPQEWKQIAVPPKASGYILLYTLEHSPLLLNCAKQLSQATGQPIWYICDGFKKNVPAVYKRFQSPEQFVGLFLNAGYVLTNSFHGSVFSVLFQKPFYTALQTRKDAPNSRLADWLEFCQLTERLISDESDCHSADSFSFDSAHANMDKARHLAQTYFEVSIANAER